MNAYFNNEGSFVFHTATLGVIQTLKAGSYSQKFFGGGLVADIAKNVADDTEDHTMEITALAISTDRNSVLTGQLGSAPVAFIWNASDATKQ